MDANGTGSLCVLTKDLFVRELVRPLLLMTEEARAKTSLQFTCWCHERISGSWNNRLCTGIDDRWSPPIFHYKPQRRPRVPVADQPAPVAPPANNANDSDEDFACLPQPLAGPRHESQSAQHAAIVRPRLLVEDGVEEAIVQADQDELTENERLDTESDTGNDASEDKHNQPNNSDEDVDIADAVVPVDAESIWDRLQREAGLIEQHNVIFRRGPGDAPIEPPLGHIEMIHSTHFSMKAVCHCEGHKPPDGANPRNQHGKFCYLLTNAHYRCVDKYNGCLQWLLEGPAASREEHIARAQVLKRTL